MGEKNWMKKVVFIKELSRLHDALENFDIDSFLDKKAPIKMHMGEIKNKYFIKPELVKVIVECLKSFGVNPFLFDTTVAYPGLRHYKTGYQKVAKIHGFTYKKVGCKVVIDDIGMPKIVEGREYDVAEHIVNSTHIFALSHVKGHVATGMGGAIKNFGMGGVTKETKRIMHNGSKPIFDKNNCTYCGRCSEVCPFGALEVKDSFWKINKSSCFGCGVCVENCKNNALSYKENDIQFALACATKACVQGKKVIYLNDVNRISDSCDCDPRAKKILCPDIGYLISDDPVAIDKASLDLIHHIKPDVFEKSTKINPIKQIKYGEEIGLGTSSYKLIEV